ncbi:MAG: SUMF1/EgtB/PvdO family nonheme iron enzyme [Acidobacteria bacterium]|nr:SUMF1/EgtB/PvdO family nonheme iron enzyme [Acidobacteriota bacterium]
MTPQFQPIGHYQILAVLGKGGMGTVYRAQDTRIGREVALKVISSGGELEARERFQREARSAGILSHPNIVTVHEFGEADAGLYIVMELVNGPGLDKLTRERGRLDPALVASVVRQTGEALDCAHGKGIVHRDIKPGNIMLGEGGRVKVTDFGIAKMLLEPGVTQVGFAVGSPSYMSPEQMRGENLDGRADQFSLAVVAYELLTGTRPFAGDTLPAVLHNILFLDPPPAHTLNPSLPERASAALSKAMAKKAADRFATCAEFAADLEASFARAAPSRRWVWKLAGLAILLLAILAAAIGVYLPRTRAPGGMVLVEGGEARLGPNRQPVRVEAFYIDRTEVTNRAYAQFCRETGRAAPLGPPENPVVNVTFEDAQAFARWAGKRLPTAIEWEKAARGANGRTYPWGEEPAAGRANLPASAGLAPANSFPASATPDGVLNLVGNAWEWVNTPAQPPSGSEFERYARLFEELSPPLTRSEPFYQIRGGSYRFLVPADQTAALVCDSSPVPARARKPDIGFRCAR